ncbi:MAG: hypothetical protein EOO99_01560 [Pedobacter sp.]|jgi:uncharacterized metal-binding protein|nr:MAG: hypothetical protein EOO99_01560 [Pedobacter sp.]
MNATSLIFFGFLLLPLIAFIAWLIKQDKKRSYWGILLLIVGMVIAAYSIIVLDRKYTEAPENNVPKASSFR